MSEERTLLQQLDDLCREGWQMTLEGFPPDEEGPREWQWDLVPPGDLSRVRSVPGGQDETLEDAVRRIVAAAQAWLPLPVAKND